jgi:hypothetical protein
MSNSAAIVITTILLWIEGDPCVRFPETENWREELLKARDVLKRSGDAVICGGLLL